MLGVTINTRPESEIAYTQLQLQRWEFGEPFAKGSALRQSLPFDLY
jgi:hypothetical protein